MRHCGDTYYQKLEEKVTHNEFYVYIKYSTTTKLKLKEWDTNPIPTTQ